MKYDCKGTTRSLYIHWPFCPYKCHFCPFVALAGHDQFMQRYHQALLTEMDQFVQQYEKSLELDTIFFGGGTPSTYPNDLLLDMSDKLRSKFVFSKEIEVSIEINPGTVSKEQLAVWRQAGINRLSIGVQSLNDTVLKKLNRHQKAQDVFWLLKHAETMFENISIDLILGLPGISINEWKQLVQQVVTWPIKHVSMYFLTVHENTPLYFNVKKKQVQLPPDDEIVDLYYWSRDMLEQHNFQQYELSNFGKPGYESRHNSVYWERKPYKGIGLGACSFDGKRRLQNEKNLMKYMYGIEQGESVAAFSETLTTEQIRLEEMMLNLRRPVGTSWEMLTNGLTIVEQTVLKKRVTQLKEKKLLEEKDGRFTLAPAGLVLENEIIMQLSVQ